MNIRQDKADYSVTWRGIPFPIIVCMIIGHHWFNKRYLIIGELSKITAIECYRCESTVVARKGIVMK